MLGGADNPNGELPSYITGANRIPASMQRPLVKPGCSMPGFAGHATRRTGNAAVGIAPAGYEFNRPRGGKAIRVACPHPSSPLPGPNVLSGFA